MNKHAALFEHPRCIQMRQYEALRAYHYEDCSVEEAAARGGYTTGSFRNLLTRFNQQPTAAFFWPPAKTDARKKKDDPRPARILAMRRQDHATITEIHSRLEAEKIPGSLGYIQGIFTREGIKRFPRNRTRFQPPRVIADCRRLDLRPRTFHTDFGGLFLFAFDLAQMKVHEMVHEVNLPSTTMIPAECAMLSLLALKLYGIGRPSQVMAEPLDEGLALFTGLNVIPKRSTLTEYSIDVDPNFAAPLMHAWYHAAANLTDVIGKGASIDLNFHTIPYHGDQALMQKHYVSKRGRSQYGILRELYT